MQNLPAKVLILSAETSGDALACTLVSALQQKQSGLAYFGMGGPTLDQVGVTRIVAADDLAIVGLTGLVKHFHTLRHALRTIKLWILQEKPALVILVDYPGFNLQIAKFASKCGCRVLFYVSPQIWAWRYQRIHLIRKYVDHMAVLFPFEEKIYLKEKVPVTYVGHPLTQKAHSDLSITQAREQFGLAPQVTTIGLFPGSRSQEIQRLLPVMLESAARLQAQLSTVQFILPQAPGINLPAITSSINLKYVQGNIYDVIRCCDAIIATSGTVTLEIALMSVPQIILYKMAPFSLWLARRLVKIPHFGLCNIVSDELIAKELLQQEVTPTTVCHEIIRLLDNQNYRQQVIERCDKMRAQLSQQGCAEKTAEVALELLGKL